MKSKEWFVKATAIFLFVALLAISAYFLIDGWLGGHFDSFESFRDYIKAFGAWGPIILTLIQILQVILPVLPGFLGCIVGAALFGANIGFWVNYIGISVGSIIAFWLARRYGVKLVNKMISMDKYEAYIEKINKSKSYPMVLFLSILLPLAPDDFLCYFSGLISMSSKKFISIILLAKPWCILIYSIFFAYFI
jgi:uncharacterized membrane protein YdjX (TVP38/TMEM64 family)